MLPRAVSPSGPDEEDFELVEVPTEDFEVVALPTSSEAVVSFDVPPELRASLKASLEHPPPAPPPQLPPAPPAVASLDWETLADMDDWTTFKSPEGAAGAGAAAVPPPEASLPPKPPLTGFEDEDVPSDDGRAATSEEEEEDGSDSLPVLIVDVTRFSQGMEPVLPADSLMAQIVEAMGDESTFAPRSEQLLQMGIAFHSSTDVLKVDMKDLVKKHPDHEFRVMEYPGSLAGTPTVDVWGAVRHPTEWPCVDAVKGLVEMCHRDLLWKADVCVQLDSLAADGTAMRMVRNEATRQKLVELQATLKATTKELNNVQAVVAASVPPESDSESDVENLWEVDPPPRPSTKPPTATPEVLELQQKYVKELEGNTASCRAAIAKEQEALDAHLHEGPPVLPPGKCMLTAVMDVVFDRIQPQAGDTEEDFHAWVADVKEDVLKQWYQEFAWLPTRAAGEAPPPADDD